jgi:hypothetical protein
VGEAILESDEIKTIVNVAAVVSGNSWAVPIINGADAIDEGADPEDVLKTIVISTVAAGAADAVGEVAAEALTDKVGSTVANFIADTGVNVVTNGGDIGAAVLDAGLKGSKIVSNTTNTIVDSLGIDTSTDLGKTLDKSLKTGISAEIMGEDGVKAASIAAISDTIINPVLERGNELTPEALGDVSKLVSTALVAGAKGENVYDAINQELGNTATADLRNLVRTKVKDFIDPVEELPMDTGEFLTEAVLPSKETLDKFRDTSITEKDLPYSPQNLQAPNISEEEKQKFLSTTGVQLGKSSDIAKLMDQYRLGQYKATLANLSKDEKKAYYAPYIQMAKDLGYNLKQGALEEFALTAGGLGRGIDEFAEFLNSNFSITPSSGLSIALAGADLVETFTGLDVYPFDRDKQKQITKFSELAKPVKEYLLDESEKAGTFISKEMADRQKLALPAPGTTLEDIFNGVAKDRAGRPFGTDIVATMMTGAQDLPDIATDIALVAINPVLGGAAALGASGAAAYEESGQEIDAKIDKAYKDGTLAKTDAFNTLVKKFDGDEDKAVAALKEKGGQYAKVAGSVGGISDAILGKLAIGQGVKNSLGIVPSAFSKIGVSAVTEGGTEGFEQYLTNKATKYLGTAPMDGVGAQALMGFVSGGQGGTIGAGIDVASDVSEVVQTDPVSKDITAADKEAWIRTIIGEAAGESDAGQAAVAHTILNRYKDGGFGKSLQDVVYADKQFSTYNPLDQGGNTLHQKSKSSPEYKRAEKLVNDILKGKVEDPTEGATHYWNPDVANPSWGDTILSQHKSGGKKIDSHIFGGNTGAVDTVDVAEVADNIDKKPTTPTATADVLDTGQVDAEPETDISAEVVAEILNKPTNFVTDSDVDVVTDVVASLETATDPTVDLTTTVTPTTTTTTTTTTPSSDIPVAPEQGIAQLAGARQVTLDPPEVAEIDYTYDFDSIFANPEQEKLFTSPYKNFTTERDVFDNFDNDARMTRTTPYERTTEEILNILRGVA